MKTRKTGMLAMLSFIVLYLLAIALVIFGAVEAPPLMVLGILWLSIGWIPFLGLKVLKPQEALVLTLFGKYVGTLKGDGFYFVNPFCTAVNPAADTKLGQSGDVDDEKDSLAKVLNVNSVNVKAMPSKKIGDKYKDVAHPLLPETREKIAKAIFKKYEETFTESVDAELVSSNEVVVGEE